MVEVRSLEVAVVSPMVEVRSLEVAVVVRMMVEVWSVEVAVVVRMMVELRVRGRITRWEIAPESHRGRAGFELESPRR
jgi:hypothetical protein